MKTLRLVSLLYVTLLFGDEGLGASSQELPAVNALAESYARLILAMGQQDPGYVDAFYGPESWQTEAAAKKESLPQIARKSAELRAQLAALPRPSGEMDQLRLEYLTKQLTALESRVEILGGKRMTFNEESRALYDAVAPTFPDEYFAKQLDAVASILHVPNDSHLTEHYADWRKAFIVPKEKLDAVFQLAIKECRARTLAHLQLPPGENFTVEYVTDKPWGGYNWYKGNYRSIIQVNTDLPVYIDRAMDLAAHEGYPGHHVYNSLLEKNLVRERGWMEFSVYPLYTPQSLIAEGTANFGRELVMTQPEKIDFEKKVLWPAAGLDPARVEEYYKVQALLKKIAYAANEAARRLIDGQIDEKAATTWLKRYALLETGQAEHRVKFIQNYRSYVINYNLGEDMVRRHIESHGGTQDKPEKRWQIFGELLASPRLPSGLTP